MTEPNTTIASTGAVLVILAKLTIGPLLGEYSIILALGLIGTLIALSEQEGLTWKQSLIFVFKGLAFCLIFTGLVTTLALSYLPTDSGLTPYALLGAVSFLIGWTSSKWNNVKDWFISIITSFSGKKE